MWKLAWRGLRTFWTLHIAGGVSLAVAALVISGALMVAHSVGESLRYLALRRIGPTDCAVVSSRGLKEEVSRLVPTSDSAVETAGLLVVPCIVSRLAPDGTESYRVANVNLVGFDPAFLDFTGSTDGVPGYVSELEGIGQQEVVLNRHLWKDLGQPETGEILVIRTPVLSEIPREFVMGRKDRVLGPGTPATLKGVLRGVEFPAEFTLRPGPRPPRNLFAPIEFVQQLTDARGKINTVLVSSAGRCDPGKLLDVLRGRMTPEQLGLRVRIDDLGYVALESERMVLHPAVVEAGRAVAARQKLAVAPTAIQVATSIRKVGAAGREIPYSVVAAFDVSLPPPLGGLTLVSGEPAPVLAEEEILLNTWAAEDLGAAVGDRIALSYYVTDLAGRLVEQTSEFRLAGIVQMRGLAADPDLVPEYKGVTDARSISQWDAPFPVDLRRIRPKDEEYWEKYRTVPKAFVSPAAAERLWRSRWGLWTSLRFAREGAPPSQVAETIRANLVGSVDLQKLGVSVAAVRDRALAAAQGSTDFRGLFVGLSFFLLAAAIILAMALYRLFLVRRTSQIGLLAALGFNRGQIFGLLLLESMGAVVPCSVAGALAGAGFAKLLILGLATRWQGALRLNELYFYFSPGAVVAAALITALLAVPVYYFSLRGFLKRSVRSLLAGRGEEHQPWRAARWSVVLAAVAGGAGLLAALAAVFLNAAVVGFFVAGVLLLIAGLALVRRLVAVPRKSSRVRPGVRGLIWLGGKHLRRTPTRTMLIGALVSCATFMVVAVGANRHEPEKLSRDRASGHGGFALVATTAVPIYLDLNRPEDRHRLAIDRPDDPLWDRIQVFRLRLRQGDDASCLNAYRPQQPAILGVPASFRQRDGFRFARTIRETDNPWQLLEEPTDAPDRIPAIGDNQTLTWILHRGVGDELTVSATTGEKIRLWFVGALHRSVFQSELIISEEQFVRYFPDADGYRFFLVDCDPGEASRVQRFLEQQLGAYGFDAMLTVERLEEYLRVENTYLDTFQVLGGLGLVLGAAGLGAVMWRSVLERAGELALLRAIGYRPAVLAVLVLLEDTALVLLGVSIGALSAVVAIVPHLVRAAEEFPALQIMTLLLAVVVVGIGTGALALVPVVRLPVVDTLRREA